MKFSFLLSAGAFASFLGFLPLHVAGQTVCTGAVMTNSTDVNCNSSNVGVAYWVPLCGSIPFPSTLPGSSNNQKIIFLYNRQPSRRLQLTGRDVGRDIMIGSPGTSDTFSGGAASNTYVVGNQPARLVVDPASSTPYVVSSTNETDRLNLVSSGIDFINIKPEGQKRPGTITTAPTRDRLSISQTNPPTNSTWNTCPPAVVHMFPSASPRPLVAMGAQHASEPAKLMLAQGGENSALMEEELPGVPLVVDFDLSTDQIILTEELVEDVASLQLPSPYVYANYPLTHWPEDPASISQSIERKQVVPIFVVRGVTFSHASTTSKLCRKELDCIVDASMGLTNVPTNITPLIYFQNQGLLVSSRMNAKPLGSSENPGKVVARLMNGNGSALRLPVSPKNPIYNATFIAIQPRDAIKQSCDQTWQRKGYPCPLRDQKASPYQTHSGERNVQSSMAPSQP